MNRFFRNMKDKKVLKYSSKSSYKNLFKKYEYLLRKSNHLVMLT